MKIFDLPTCDCTQDWHKGQMLGPLGLGATHPNCYRKARPHSCSCLEASCLSDDPWAPDHTQIKLSLAKTPLQEFIIDLVRKRRPLTPAKKPLVAI